MARIDAFLRTQHDNFASDLHLSPGNRPLCRVYGELKPISQETLTHEGTTALIYEILNEYQKKKFEQTRDIDLAYELPEINARFRVNVFFSRLGLSAVFRLIPTQVLTAAQLHLPDVILKFARQKKGLIVVTGATGSGKSTTLAAMVDYINRSRKEHILTVEDPIEFVHKGMLCLINQREVGVHTSSFSAALRSALREDPDVILVGEMRDLETIELAITAAETGHLVLGTLHTSTAAKTVDRMINVFPADQQAQIRAMLSESLKGVIAQNLLRATDGKRVAAFEILVNTPAVSSLIREGKTHQVASAMQTGKADGMIMMDDSLKELLAAGRISPEEAMKYASTALGSQLLTRRSGIISPVHETH